MDKKTRNMYNGMKIIPSHLIKERLEEIERVRVASAINTILDVLVDSKLITKKGLINALNLHIKIILNANEQLFKEEVQLVQKAKKEETGGQNYIG